MPKIEKYILVWSMLLTLAVAPGLRADQMVAKAGMMIADSVVVKKTERKLYLIHGEHVLKSYDIALGLVPEGHKSQEGDFRTPEGRYTLTKRNMESDFFLSIQVSYPDERDESKAKSLGVSPGGGIMLHGQPNDPQHSEDYYRNFDWTDGCIALSNDDIRDVWRRTLPNTPIHILP